jgi:predicted GNAT family acetyltransferase
MDELKIEHAGDDGGGAWFIALDGRRVGEMSYVTTGAGEITILHTEVGEELRGRGAGAKLVEAGVAWARANHKKVVAQCAYAKATIAKRKELQDVLAG